jgi:HemK-related putative methylase
MKKNNSNASNKTNISNTVYEPEEDSYLMQEQVKKYVSGNVLDMGCGSGILGITALKKNTVTKVTFADINPEALLFVKNKLKEEESKDAYITKAKLSKCQFIHTDLYSKIKKEKSGHNFDMIIFNPPYLPNDEFDNERLITTGGKNGHEIIEKFLTDSKKYLNNEGIILLIFSTLTGKKIVDDIIKDLKYSKETISRKKLFMEELFVYNIKSVPDKVLFYGHRGVVSLEHITYNGKNIKAAVKTPLSKNYNYTDEAKFLKVLNKKGIGPKLYKINKKDKSIIMEYIDGARILDFFADEKIEKNNILDVIEKILKQVYTLDLLGITKNELINPYKHIIIGNNESRIGNNESRIGNNESRIGNNESWNNEPVMIDFERCQYTDRPKNITQFIQFLCSGRVNYLFKEKGIIVNITRLRDVAKDYKGTKDKNIINKILACIN